MFLFRFYILCENFSKIGPIIKKIPKFQSDPLKFEAWSVSYLFFIVQRDWGKDELVGVGLEHFYFNSLAANYRV